MGFPLWFYCTHSSTLRKPINTRDSTLIIGLTRVLTCNRGHQDRGLEALLEHECVSVSLSYTCQRPWDEACQWCMCLARCGGTDNLILVGTTDCFTAYRQKTSSFASSVYRKSAMCEYFQEVNRNSSFTKKICVCACVAFLAGSNSWSEDSNWSTYDAPTDEPYQILYKHDS
jgi:hypothetical protein